MKKILYLILLLIGLQKTVEAAHLKGGWIQYEYVSHDDVNKTSQYRITIYQYILCSSGSGQIDGIVHLGIFDASNNSLINNINVDSVKNGSVILNKTTYDPCINNNPPVCYLINKYTTVVNLPDNDAGYILAVQRCCRIAGIENIVNSGQVGITYSNQIPGVINGVSYRANSSPAFVQKDTSLICFSSPFTIDFHAIDAENDSLSYSFCDGLLGGFYSNDPGSLGTAPNPASNPPYTSIPYKTPKFGGGFPLGTKVSIDPITGIISGTAPNVVGDYVIAVCVSEFRNGVLIGVSRKEIHITVADCSLSAADLRPSYINCNGLSFTFFNESTSSNITSYQWIFGDTAAHSNDTSYLPMPIHVYGDTGIFHLHLFVRSGNCIDSAKSSVRVYPGFKANFVVKSSCILNPYNFFDSTYSKYGKVYKWHWNLGETTTNTDTFLTKNPSYKYPTIGSKDVTLIAEDNNGCMDTITKTIIVREKPLLNLPFKDTLICNVDTLQLAASITNPSGTPVFTWTPKDSIINPNSSTPFVHPKNAKNTFYISLTDDGCAVNDSVLVYTLAHISVKTSPDTNICQTDTIRLFADTHTDKRGIKLTWTSNTGETIEPIQNPLIKPLVNPAHYYVFANLGNKCFARDTTTVFVYPFPFANAGNDDSVCYNGNIQLHASIVGDSYKWSPTQTLSDSTILSPISTPDSTTSYYLTAFYTQKNTCPKPFTDTIKIAVIPQVIINAGRDTSVVFNQPLQLKVACNVDTTTTQYQWYNLNGFETYLNKTDVFNPIGIYPIHVDSLIYQVKATIKNPKQCYALDTIKVLVFKTPPEIFVPSAFTPNGDGINDKISPIPVGIHNLNFFSIFNRLGQQLYTTSQIGEGWDGTYQGVNQPAGTYVYMVQGTNYLGIKVFNKGTIVLIR